jgi:hypothetical protein
VRRAPPPGPVRQTKRTCCRDPHERGVGDRRQVDVPDAIAELGCYLGRDLYRQSGLANAARTGQGNQPVIAEQTSRVGHLRCAADEARQLRRKMLRHSDIRYP